MRPDWFPDWSDSVCAIIASGASVKQDDVDKLKGRCRVAVVNNSYTMAPWADLLYAADARWWDQYPDARKFAGLKVTPDAPAAKRYGLNLVHLVGETDKDADQIIIERSGLIARGGNSGFQVFNLVAQFAARKVILLGFDFCGDHWHEKHPMPLKNPKPHTLEKWARRFDAQADVIREVGIDVVNASMASALVNYPKLSLDQALVRWL